MFKPLQGDTSSQLDGVLVDGGYFSDRPGVFFTDRVSGAFTVESGDVFHSG